jgi:putative phosphoribosyl transferase
MHEFADRVDAGRRLAKRLDHLRGTDTVVLGLPRGGVPVAYEVAETLDAPLDVIVVRKLGYPRQPELAMGAIGEGGVRVQQPDVLSYISAEELERVATRESAILQDKLADLRRGRPRIDLEGRLAVIVDDGIATGATAKAAAAVAQRLGAARVLLATPVAPAATVRSMRDAAEIICLSTPVRFLGVGAHYRDFSPTSDDEVARLLNAASRRMERRGTSEA